VTVKHMGIQWTEDTLIYRSSIWNRDGELISAGFKKFFNYTEQPDLVPDPTDDQLVEGSIVEKMDGSLLIISKYKGELICRTRGTFNVENLENGFEIEFLKKKYPKLFNSDLYEALDYEVSILCEWTTPTNVIVLKYGDEPELKLIGIIYHGDYSMMQQSTLESWSRVLDVPRPMTYTFNNVQHMVQTIKHLEDKEGVVVYYECEQIQKKFNAAKYLKLHRFKENATWKNVLRLYVDGEYESIANFMEYIKNVFDFECLEMITQFVAPIHCASVDELGKLAELKEEVENLKKFKETRKDQALYIIEQFGNTKYKSVAFLFLDNKKPCKDAMFNLIYDRLPIGEQV
jgi:hypothetical protein